MLKNNERLPIYLESTVNSVFKVLPLYEEKNIGIELYIESLLSDIYNLDTIMPMVRSPEYISLLSSLESIKKQISHEDNQKKIIRREVFKSINIIKNIINNVEDSDSYEKEI